MDDDLSGWFEPKELAILLGLLKDHRNTAIASWLHVNKDNITESSPDDLARHLEDVRGVWKDGEFGKLYKKLKALRGHDDRG